LLIPGQTFETNHTSTEEHDELSISYALHSKSLAIMRMKKLDGMLRENCHGAKYNCDPESAAWQIHDKFVFDAW
jgi:hypothetical protein